MQGAFADSGRMLGQRSPDDSNDECTDRRVHFSLLYRGRNRRHGLVRPGDWRERHHYKARHRRTACASASLTIVLGWLQVVCAVVLAVTLYAITRHQDSDLAMLAAMFRIGEGLLGAISTRGAVDLLWLGTSAGPKAHDPATLQVLGTYLLAGPDWNMDAILFAMGSTLFSYLFLRGRIIPVLLAWLGVVASVLLVVGLPLQLAGWLRGPITGYMWRPMAAFEVPLGFWLMIKGVRTAATD